MSTFVSRVARAFLEVLQPITSSARLPDRLKFELAAQGWAVNTIKSADAAAIRSAFGIVELFDQAETLAAELDTNGADNSELVSQIVDLLGQMLETFRADGKANPSLPYPLDQAGFWTEFGRGLVDKGLARFLGERHPVLFGTARIVGLIDIEAPTSFPNGRTLVERPILRWDRLGTVASGPRRIGAEVYGWGASQGFAYLKFQRALMDLLASADVPSRLSKPPAGTLSAFYDVSNPVAQQVREVVATFANFGSPFEDAFAEAAIAILPIPALDGQGPPVGWSIRPVVTGTFPSQNPDDDDGIFDLAGGFGLTGGVRVDVRPDSVAIQAGPAGSSITYVRRPSAPFVLIGSDTGSRLELDAIAVRLGIVREGNASALHLAIGALDEGSGGPFRLVLDMGDADGFLKSTAGSNEKHIEFRTGLHWSSLTGFSFDTGSGLEVDLPVNISFGGITIEQVTIGIGRSPDGGAVASGSVQANVAIGPVSANILGLGATFSLTPAKSGKRSSFADVDLTFGFKSPTGVGISVNSGPVSGGGFLTLEDARYTGILQLQIYSVSVTAFGVIETKLPGGAPGFSFAIVISAEFNPIQLGLGFTLLGVGGIIGINRRIDEDALRSAVRTGSLEHLLFPHDVIHDAPQIIHDLQAILPATNGRYVFGPMAKIGWGTPTLIEAELGIILELPGPRLALLGEVHALLPRRDKAIVKLHLSVAGLLDFPKKVFAIDASLHDSQVGPYPLTGDMAMRLLWGDQPSFALAVGGFHPAFQPPPGFPPLRRVALDLGVSGNPSLTVQGYFAITSNSVQTGGLVELKASGDGIDLNGRLQFDAILVFSPFSFEVDLSASVRVSFHGHGIGVHLSGVLTGPSPWRVRGEVCVSILFWDACLGFDKSFGSATPVKIPAIDPWSGVSVDNTDKLDVPGLEAALNDHRNWSAELPSAGFACVSLVGAKDGDPLLDPLGTAVVRQKVCPLNLEMTRFGAAPVTAPVAFTVQTATINGKGVDVKKKLTYLQEPFAKAQFVEMSDAAKLSAPSFEPLDGGMRIPANDNTLLPGSRQTLDVTYTTILLGDDGSEEKTDNHALPLAHLIGMSRRSAAGLTGLRRVAAEAYVDPTASPRFTVAASEGFVIAKRSTFKSTDDILKNATTKLQASLALSDHLTEHPEDQGELEVVPQFEVVAG